MCAQADSELTSPRADSDEHIGGEEKQIFNAQS